MQYMRMILFMMLTFSVSMKSTLAEVAQIHFGTTHTPHEGLTITWSNSGDQDYIQWGYTAELETGNFPASRRTFASKVLFDYTFPTLLSDTVIYYSIYDSMLDTWSDTLTFRTAAMSGESFSFKAMGDSQTDPWAWHDISAVTRPSDFTLFTGDIVETGGNETEWDYWFGEGKEFLEKNLFYSALGNHELEEDPDASFYQNLLTLPVNPFNSELYYSFNYRNAVFICLNSSDAWNTDQYDWLINTLEENRDVPWKIVFFHIPFYTSPVHEGEMDNFFDTWWKAFDDYGVDLIFNGHTHNYQRSVPLNRNYSIDSPAESYGSQPMQGRCQIVTGGAGAHSHGEGTGWFIDTTFAGLHYIRAEVFSNRIVLQVFDTNNVQMDSLSLRKDFHPQIEASSLSVCEGESVTLTGTGADSFSWDNGVINGVPFSPTETSTYTLTASSDGGLSEVLTIEIKVNPKNYFSESYSICQNDSLYWHGTYYHISGTYYDSFQNIWGCDSIYALNLTVNPVFAEDEEIQICAGDSLYWHGHYYRAAGTYYDNYRNIWGCDSIVILNLTVLPSPDKPVISGETEVTAGQMHLYAAAQNDSLNNTWTVENGEISSASDYEIEIHWPEPGTGYVYLTSMDQQGCSNEGQLLVNISKDANLVMTDPSGYPIQIFPNPVKDILTVKYPEVFSLEIYTVSGVKMLVSQHTQTDISQLLPGMYILQLRDREHRLLITSKLLIE